MANPFESASWFQVAGLRPRLKPHVRVRRHRYRGRLWYVLDDGAAGKAHRIASGAYRFVGRLDGKHSVTELWERLIGELGEEAPTQDDVIASLGQLHAADLLASDTLPDTVELARRQKKQRWQLWMQNLRSPMSLRVPLVDPEHFLNRSMARVAPLFGPLGAVLWLLAVVPALFIVGANWQELTGNLADKVLAADNLLIMAICYPFVKTVHELGHGYAAKKRGCEVREMGIMLLVLFPVPYVDASAASALQSKWHRAFIGAAGIIAELFLAAIACFVWALLEPGIARAIAYNVMLIAGISTVIVNGNPLLRFDGYYVLADVLEIPNLGTRANQYWGYLVDRYIFGTHGMAEFEATPGEKRWFLIYGPAAFIMRMVVLLGIALLIGQRFFILGVLLAIWTVVTGIGLPLWKAYAHVFTAPVLNRNRRQAKRLTLAGTAAILLLLFVVPAPHHIYAQGVVWLPERAHVRAQTDGTITHVSAQPGAMVEAGTMLLQAQAPELSTEAARLSWRLRELQAEADQEFGGDQVKRELSRLAYRQTEAQLAVARERLRELRVDARTSGRFALAGVSAADLPGRHVRKGELIGYVTPAMAEVARIAVPQDDIDLVRQQLRSVRFRIAAIPGRQYAGRVVRAIPGGTHELPAAALAQSHGGTIPLDPTDPEGLRTLNRVFLFDIALPAELQQVPFGTRVHARLKLAWEPIGWQVARRLRQLLLSRFDA